MTDNRLTEQFEAQRPRLRAVAFRMLGSRSEAEDALQDAWLRASRADISDVENLGAWLTTVVARVCLNALRARASRREDELDDFTPDFVVGADPLDQVALADSVGIALLVVLETLSPSERLAFVLHDLFALSFDEIAPLVERTPTATRQLASRARRRVRGRAPAPDTDLVQQREAVDAFFAAARDGDFEALVAVLHPQATFRATGLGPVPFVLEGATTVASNARMFGPDSAPHRHTIVNGAAGVFTTDGDRLASITSFTIAGGRILSIDVLADPSRLSDYDMTTF